MRKRGMGAVIAVVALSLAAPMSAAAQTPAASQAVVDTVSPAPTSAEQPVTQLIVKYESGIRPTEAPGVATGDSSVDGVDLAPGRKMSLGLRTVELSEPVTQAEARVAAAELAADPRVKYAEPDYLTQPTTDVSPATAISPNDDFYTISLMWGLNGPFGIDGPDAWAVTTGSSSVVVAVLDTGSRPHEDLDAAKQVPGYDMIMNSLIANDSDGRDSDPTDPGDGVTADALAGGLSAVAPLCTVRNSSWHGLHVTGTVNAKSDNSIGVASVAPGVKVQPVRVLGRCGGFSSDTIDGIVWASGGYVPAVDVNASPADVINMSLVSSGSCSVSYQTAIDAAVGRGTTVVAAAGNNAVDVSGASPASCNNVIAVGAVGQDGKRASYSNYGAGIDVSAPGDLIVSTSNTGPLGPGADAYANMWGTSQAAPHVAGLAALITSRFPTLTPAQIETRIKTYVKAFPGGACDPSASMNHCGSGIANADSVPTVLVPGVATSVTATPQNGSVDVAWTAPNDNGSTITGYNVQAYVGPTLQPSKVCSTSSVAPTAATTQCTVTGLTNGTTYTFRVTATNSFGTGAEAPSPLAMPFDPPAPVTLLPPPVAAPAPQVSAPGAVSSLKAKYFRSRAAVLWSVPASNGGAVVSHYTYRVSKNGGRTWAGWKSTTSTNASVTRKRKLRYAVQISPVNSAGQGIVTQINLKRY